MSFLICNAWHSIKNNIHNETKDHHQEKNYLSDPNPGMTKILELLDSFKIAIINMLKDLMKKVNNVNRWGISTEMEI